MKNNWFAVGLIFMFLVFSAIFAFNKMTNIAGWLIAAVFCVLFFWGWNTDK